MVGMVSCHNDDDTISMVEVEFHNASTYHSFSVPNNIGWTMASLSEQALLLAVEKVESEPRYMYICTCTCTCIIHTYMYMYIYYTHRRTCMYMYMLHKYTIVHVCYCIS